MLTGGPRGHRLELPFGADDNEVTLVFADGRALSLPRASKLAIADKIWDHLVNALAGRDPAPPTVAETTTAAVRPWRQVRFGNA